jgi:hypothetical protein
MATPFCHLPIKNDSTLDFGVPYFRTLAPSGKHDKANSSPLTLMMNSRVKNPGLEDFESRKRGATGFSGDPGLVNIQKTMENHHFSWENSTISTGPFSVSQTVSHYQRVTIPHVTSESPGLLFHPLTTNFQAFVVGSHLVPHDDWTSLGP